MLIRDALIKYREEVSILKKGFDQERHRISSLLRNEAICSLKASKVTSVDIATYRDTRLGQINPKTLKPLSPSTVRLEMSLLSNMFDIGRIEWGICGPNPVKDVRKPKPPAGRTRRLTAREDRQILSYAWNYVNRELYVIVVIALETCMRQKEILTLAWEHIDLRNRVVHLPETKNGSTRDVPLSMRAKETLMLLGTKSNGPVFTYSSNGLKSCWRYMNEKLGILDLHFHDLRHEAISRLFELGRLNMMEIASISGHKTLSMLKRYTHLHAIKLAKKLDSNKLARGNNTIVNSLLPYPAVKTISDDGIHYRFLDFDDLVATGISEDDAMVRAEQVLMHKIMSMLMANNKVTAPDQYLEIIDLNTVVMVNPMRFEEAF
ncbi:site-specific integrase [Methylobacillus sp. Pita2]|uniref:site-specific integrase n=1 Tax=Methylobacillus sp. Pita2 TaxID=3383245 RepID=UPI0038B5C9C7